MVTKMNNKYKSFYQYMGKMFGSRVIEKQTNDRIYDDNDKDWYMVIEDDKVQAFVSVNSKNVIKNLYTVKKEYLSEILRYIRMERNIAPSVVTNIYVDLYKRSGFKIEEEEKLKNFVIVSYQKEA